MENSDLIKNTIIMTALPFEGKKVAYLGPRKFDDPPQATFNYGDGTYVIQFHYTKDEKASERGGSSSSKTNPEDKKDRIWLNPETNPESDYNQGGDSRNPGGGGGGGSPAPGGSGGVVTP
jgi:hypothetical protein